MDRKAHVWSELAKLGGRADCDHDGRAYADTGRPGANLAMYILCDRCGAQIHQEGHVYVTQAQQDAVVRFLEVETAP